MKSMMTAAGVAFALAATALGLGTAAPASAVSAGQRTSVTIERLPAHALATLNVPHSAKSTCAAAAKSRTYTAATRLDWCAAAGWKLKVTVPMVGVVGTAIIAQYDYASWKVNSRTWNPTLQSYEETYSSGVLKSKPVSIRVTNSCTGGCYVSHNRHYPITVPFSPHRDQKEVGVESRGTATVSGSLTTKWAYSAIGSAFNPPQSKTTVAVRCDSETGYKYPAGCANPSYTPTYVVSSSKYPDIAEFDKAALLKNPSWSTLTRATPAQKKKNRRVACKGFVKTDPADSCDEFPYASTTQGGAGAAQEHVNKTENDSQGGNLVGFYNANRLFYGDKFHVKVS